ncbi:hotdog family protein [Streptomyces chartreusis]|uniref:hypothetical protein n=1 Tax=Streptomyces chartreusis TaxID=1969 RepID=UPI0036356866
MPGTIPASRDLSQADRLRSAIGCRFRVRPEFLAGQDRSAEGLLDFALWSGNPDPRYFATADGPDATPPPTWLAGIVTPYLGAQALYSGRAAARIEYLDRGPDPARSAADPPFLWLDNLRAFLAGIGFEYHADPVPGEDISAEGEVTRVEMHRSARLGEFAVVHTELTYRDPRGALLAVGRGSAILYDVANAASPAPAAARDGGVRGEPVAKPPETAREPGAGDAEEGVPEKEPRRTWAEVRAGETLPLLRRGPLAPAEIAAFFVAPGRSAAADAEIAGARTLLAAGDYQAARSAYRAIAVNPAYDFGLPRHTDAAKARSEGAPGAYDVGLQRAAWIAQGLTERLGPYARLRSVWVEIRGFVVVGDVVSASATVAEIGTDGGERQVRVVIEMRNQHGRTVATGEAVLGVRPGAVPELG